MNKHKFKKIIASSLFIYPFLILIFSIVLYVTAEELKSYTVVEPDGSVTIREYTIKNGEKVWKGGARFAPDSDVTYGGDVMGPDEINNPGESGQDEHVTLEPYTYP